MNLGKIHESCYYNIKDFTVKQVLFSVKILQKTKANIGAFFKNLTIFEKTLLSFYLSTIEIFKLLP
jgi:hypothetical protein